MRVWNTGLRQQSPQKCSVKLFHGLSSLSNLQKELTFLLKLLFFLTISYLGIRCFIIHRCRGGLRLADIIQGVRGYFRRVKGVI